MRVAVLTEPGEFSIEERERPDPDADEVLVRVTDVGICGSDVHYYEHGRIGDNVVESPLVLGHESAGVVEAVGAGVESLDAGERVAVEPGVPCRRCRFCKRGDYHLCPDVTFMATPPVDGAFAEYVAWPADYCYPLPESVSTREGALCEPLSVGVHVARRGDVDFGDTVYVSGAGPIGLLCADACRAAGASDVILSDVAAPKLERAAARGADRTVDPTETDPADAVRDYTGGRGADVVVEASGAESAIEGTLDVADRGGTVVCVGLAGGDASVEFDPVDVVHDELDLKGSFRYHDTYPAAVSLLADDAVDVEGLVDFTMDLGDVAEAFERAKRDDVVKGTIRL